MVQKTILVTEYDMGQLRSLINRSGKDKYRELRMRLIRASVVPGTVIPSDVVTMNSKVRVRDVSTGNERELRVVFPRDEDFRCGRVSVANPLGAALLGSREGDAVVWELAAMSAKFKVTVTGVTYQPEHHGYVNEK